jgi:formamidopyrimidine-DNA glycosylase
MPELPEVETIVRELTPRILGRHILTAEVLHPLIVRYCGPKLEECLPGRRIEEVRRHGKFILVRLDHGWLTIHLGMTGQLLVDGSIGPHTRAVFRLDDTTLVYDDIRMFGSIEWSLEPVRTARLGPDALNAGFLPAELLKRKAPIKAVLLNQSVFSGVGNIYADEALFRAGIHPRRRADRLSRERASRLIQVVREVLVEAVECRGSSVSDYVDTDGRRGSFQDRHQVYGREGLPCPRCGAPIRRIVVAQRGTHFCPNCQR